MERINVVLFGINSHLRKSVECSLLDNVNIVAYADSDKKYANCKKFGYKPFWYIDEIAEKIKLFDYIIVCESEYIKWIRKESMLLRKGIPYNKLVPTIVYAKGEEPTFLSTLDRFVDLQEKFDGLCFGMCYSKWGFWEHFMQNNWFKFSMNGSDLNVHSSWIRYLLLEHSELLNSVKDIILELPYYAFDWDMQCSGQVYFRMLQYDKVDEYSTFIAQKKDAKTYIERYRILKQLANDHTNANCTNYVFSNFDFTNGESFSKQSFSGLDMIWEREFPESREINELHLKNIIEMCKKNNINLHICVFPLSNTFRRFYADEYNSKRDFFYRVISKLRLNECVIDFNNMNEFTENDYKDLTHLNNSGAEKLTRMMNESVYENGMM